MSLVNTYMPDLDVKITLASTYMPDLDVKIALVSNTTILMEGRLQGMPLRGEGG